VAAFSYGSCEGFNTLNTAPCGSVRTADRPTDGMSNSCTDHGAASSVTTVQFREIRIAEADAARGGPTQEMANSTRLADLQIVGLEESQSTKPESVDQ